MNFVLFFGIFFFILCLFYWINVRVPSYKKIKYWISLGLLIPGAAGWLLIGIKIISPHHALSVAVFSSFFLIVSAGCFIIALVLDKLMVK